MVAAPTRSNTPSTSQVGGRFSTAPNSWPVTRSSSGTGRRKRPCTVTIVRRRRPSNTGGGAPGSPRTQTQARPVNSGVSNSMGLQQEERKEGEKDWSQAGRVQR